MKTHHFNLEFNIFHNLISNLSFHFPSCCIQTDFHLFIPINAIFLHLNALLSTCLICSYFLPQQSFSWLLFATIAPFLPIFFCFLPRTLSILQSPPSLYFPFSASLSVGQLSGFSSWSVLLSHGLSLVDCTTCCSQRLCLVNGSHPCVSTPNICLEEYCFFNGAIYLFCKVLQTKDVQS